MVFVTHDDDHEVNGFFENNPYEHTDNYFEIDRDAAKEIASGVGCSDDKYLIYEDHKVKGASFSRHGDEKFISLYYGVAQLILRATENFSEARKDVKAYHGARETLRNLEKKYLHL